MPYITLEPILPKLSLRRWYSTLHNQTYVDDPSPMENVVMSLEMLLEVEIGRTHIPVRDILQLERGDVVKLNRTLGKPLVLKIGGKPKFTCLPGLSGSNVAVRIDRIITEGSPDEAIERLRF
jgi:flagellar motor switch protein FliM